MINVSIEFQRYRKYSQTANSIAVGKAFYQERLYSEKDLTDMMSHWQSEEQFCRAIKELNGFYALIQFNERQLFAAVDRVRSIPLFYGQKGNNFFLSDSAEWVRQQVGNHEMDETAKQEFLLTGYVTGSDTLYPDVKQLQAGEALCVDDNKNQLSVKTYRYYRFIHKYEKNQTLEESMEELDHVLVGMFNRLIQVADGRTIVVPLSGGFDSRLIVLMLKRLGYNNVIAYTYGCLGIAEAEVSRHVAASLGIRWEFVTYNNQLWYELYNSNHMKLYQTLAAGLSSTIVIQDFPAVHIMTKNNIINGDSIFVPGHSADLLAGSRSISFPKIYSTKLVNDFKVIESVKKRHYSLTNVREQKSIYINKRVISVLEPIRQFPDNASAFESWDLSERQAKFIINSVRIYEFMGYQWWLPFWDEKFMSYWEKIPLEYRVRQLLYKQYVDKLYREVTGEAPPHLINNRSTIDNIENVIKTSLKKNKLTNYILDKSGLDKGHLKRKYNSEPMAFYGVISEEDFIRLKPTDIDYLLALLYIEVLNNREH